MPKVMTLIRTAKGLQSQYNRVNAQEGALLEAKNVVIDREGVISKSKGYDRYGNALPAVANTLFEFEDKLIVHAGTSLHYDSDAAGTWATWTGTFSPPTSADKIHAVEMNGTCLMTTSGGIYRTDGLTTSPKRAGIATGLLPTLTKTGTGLGWLTSETGGFDGSSVGYRVIWGRVDAQNNLLLGAPSFRETLANSKSGTLNWSRSTTTVTVTYTAHGYTTNDYIVVYDSSESTPLPDGTYQVQSTPTADTFTITGVDSGATNGTCVVGKDFDVSFTATIPDDIVEGDFFEVYRTALAAAASTDPGDRMYRIYRGGVTATDISNGYVSFTDVWDDAFLGAELYTNANRESIVQQNSRPPFCRDIALFKGYVWYANTKKPEFIMIQLLTVGGLQDDTDSITWTLGASTRTYINSTAENQGTNKYKRYTTGLDSENIRNTAKSLCKIINGDSGNTLIRAYYVSGVDDPPGYIVLEARTPNTASFALTANSGTPSGVWSPEMPTSGDDVSSSSDAGANRIYHSKFQQPEAVPDLNYDELGGLSNEIVRILPLRDSLIALCTEGVWRISGDTENSFVITQLDPTVKIRYAETAVVLNNSVYTLSTQGVVKVTESGTSIVSRPIETDIKEMMEDEDYPAAMFAVAYESERRYDLWTTHTDPRKSYVYNYLTQAWTDRRKNIACGHVMKTEDRLYCGQVNDKYILQERKTDSVAADFCDEDISVTLTGVGTYTNSDGETCTYVTLTWDTDDCETLPAAGWAITQGAYLDNQYSAYVASATMGLVGGSVYSGTLYLDRQRSYTVSTATLTISIPSRVRWAPEIADSVGALKQFSFAQVYLEPDTATIPLSPWKYDLKFYSDLDTTERSANSFSYTTLTGGASLRSMVPRQDQVCSALSLIFEHNQAQSRFAVANVTFTARMMSDRTAHRA